MFFFLLRTEKNIQFITNDFKPETPPHFAFDSRNLMSWRKKAKQELMKSDTRLAPFVVSQRFHFIVICWTEGALVGFATLEQAQPTNRCIRLMTSRLERFIRSSASLD